MGLFDWLELGGAGADAAQGGASTFGQKLASALPGNMTLSMGDDLEAYILGGSQLQVFGQYSQFTVDVESMLEHIIPGLGGLAGALFGGTTGYSNFVYGKNADLLYGEDIEIKRAVSAKANGKNYFWDWMTKGSKMFEASSLVDDGKPAATPQQTSVDDVVGPVCGVLAAAQILTALAFDLVIALKYPAPNPDQQLQDEYETLATTPPKPGTNVYQELEDSMNIPAGPAAMTNLFKTLSWTIPSRIGAILIEFELLGQATRDANKDVYLADVLKTYKDSGDVNPFLRTLVVASAIGTGLSAVGRGLTAVETAIKKYAWAILIVGSLVAMLAAAITVMGLAMSGKI